MPIGLKKLIIDGVDDTFYFGDENTNGSWRIIISGTELSIQKREGGVWVEKSAFTP